LSAAADFVSDGRLLGQKQEQEQEQEQEQPEDQRRRA
jgi:hypothetical protein